MGSAQVESMLPLRWLRWTFYRDSYDDLAPEQFLHHVRAYILFMIGCFLLPDTSRSHVSLQWLPLLADVHIFSRMSIGGAVLAHLYREICHATRPTRTYIAGCVALLQVWSWERLHIGRPTLRVPQIFDLAGRPLGCRWGEDRIRELPSGNTMTYRDDFDALRMTQVSMTPYTQAVYDALPIECQDGRDIWRARVPLISWKRAEWHLPDRVMRQFGGAQPIDIEPMDQNFRRIDGRGRADLDWIVQYRDYLQLWDERRAYVVALTAQVGSGNQQLSTYLRWYRSWASIYLLRPQTQPPETFFPRSPGERLVADYYIRSSAIVEPLAGGDGQNASSLQLAIDQVAELSARVQQSVYIDYTTFDTRTGEQIETGEQRPGSYRAQGPRRSTSEASSRSMGSMQREPAQGDLPRHSMYTPSIHYDATGAGPSTHTWSPYSGQGTVPGDVYYGTQSQQPTTYSLFPMAIPEWMSSVGLPSSPTQQDIMLMGGHPSLQETQVSQHHAEEANRQDDESLQEPHLQRRRRKATSRYTPGSGAIPRRH
ncbi:hypothetical protein M5K25_017684 [Dendrobium thyrsiflorum]|uniref:Aminotransferase-like plant mobile domain-containing protein n=1 Tax=Dendrobium thyrsiflorum TaxID=117978 RepID=A0ABD0UND0_DENTH